MSSLLYYGPGSRQAALRKANSKGYSLICPPIGDDGLKVNDTREAVRSLWDVPVNSLIQTLVIGPMDQAAPKTTDVLLKTLEDFDSSRVLPVLWAHDLSGVPLTIRSRCLSHWVDLTNEDVNQELVDAGFDIIEALQDNQLYKIPQILSGFKKQEHDLLNSIVDALSDDQFCRDIWIRLRPVSLLHNPSNFEILAALLEG